MFLSIDKPEGISSHTVVNVVRKITGEKRVGHGGTLDPLATGVLIVAVGRESTKRLSELSLGKDKTYLVTIVLGEERDTDDSEGKVVKRGGAERVKKEEVKKAFEKFQGEIVQIPPNFSAVKIKGKKAYQISREGQTPTIKPRKVTVYFIKLLKFKYPEIKIECKVSSGTYIRSLARDLGRDLKTYGYVKNLRRTAVGKINIKDCVALEKVTVKNWKILARRDLSPFAEHRVRKPAGAS